MKVVYTKLYIPLRVLSSCPADGINGSKGSSALIVFFTTCLLLSITSLELVKDKKKKKLNQKEKLK